MKKSIRVNDWNGFCESTKTIEVDEEELNNTYINEYGVEFLKHDGELYMCDGSMCDSFERRDNMRINIDIEDDKCCNTCRNGMQVCESERGYCIECKCNGEYKDETDICDSYK
ncbi:MAG: hypothetical protein K0S18_108 [Anaerocolumna sp.]|jgi:hypothetical protein|nr:hypothetical protein [Anaerocolumna sp.]